MTKPSTLAQYLQLDLKNNHFRYMESAIKSELISLTPECHGASLDERAFWLKTGLTEYPKCVRCTESLTTRNWYPSITKARRALGEAPKGYRQFCSKTCAMNDPEKHRKTAETTTTRFGVQHSSQSVQVQAKRKLTNLERYGATNPMAWSSDRFKEAIEELHGVSAVQYIQGVSDKIADTKKRGLLLIERVQELEKLFEVTVLSELPVELQRVHDIELTWQHKCKYIYQSNITVRGLRLCPRCSYSTSRAERYIGDWLEEQGLKVLRRDTSFGFELDLYLPELKIGIEYDGTYWHSARFVSKQKAMEKLQKSALVGVQLITIQEHLWLLTPEKVKARLLSLIGLNKKLAGRRCTVEEIPLTDANAFLSKAHLQGGARARIAVALKYNGELMSVMTFGAPRFARKAAEWELVRYAVLPGFSIQGGASKILAKFRALHSGSILSYADRCWSTGALYQELGFKFLRNSESSYFWVSGQHIFTRYQTQKSKLSRLLNGIGKDFEPALSEDDNMRAARFLKVYDRGNSVWLIDKSIS